MKISDVCNIVVQAVSDDTIMKIVSLSPFSREEEIEQAVKEVLEEFEIYITDEYFEYLMEDGFAEFTNDSMKKYRIFIHHSE